MAADFTLTQESKDIFYGHLLGDGSLCWYNNGKKKKYYVGFSISSKHADYIYYIMKRCKSAKIPFNRVKPNKLTRDKYTWYNWGTCMFTQESMKKMRTEWYDTEETSLPDDIYINKNVLLTFFIDDGYLNYSKGQLHGVALSLEDINYNDTRKIADLIATEIKLPNERVKVYKKGNGFIIRLNDKNSVKSFFDYIGDCPKELYNCFRYKWPYNKQYYDNWTLNPIGENKNLVID